MQSREEKYKATSMHYLSVREADTKDNDALCSPLYQTSPAVQCCEVQSRMHLYYLIRERSLQGLHHNTVSTIIRIVDVTTLHSQYTNSHCT